MRAIRTIVLVAAYLLMGGAVSAQQQPPKDPVHDHSTHAQQPPKDKPKEPIPSVTDADRRAAFPDDVHGHTTHDRGIHYLVLFDQFEWQGSSKGGLTLENTTWIGGDIDRAWVRTEAETHDGRLEQAAVDVLWGRSFSRWWDVVAGVRQDVRPGDPQTWAAIGIQGLAPQWFEVQATAYVGGAGRTQIRLEAEYDLLLTNRLILQPLLETEIHGKSDLERGIGKGLSSIEGGVRLRYEFTRELAPYVGVSWSRKFFGTADHARQHGDDAGSARFALGLRTWF